METHLEEDIDADVVRIRSTSTDLPLTLVFIPGNPGLITFYLEFLKCIHMKNPSWDIVGIGHSGMSSLRDDGLQTEAVYTLEEQIEHKVRAINRIVGEDSKRHVIVVGHSIGAYMAQKIVLHEDLKVKVEAVDLLTPTIVDIHRSRKGAQLTRINYWFPRFHEYVSLADKLLLRWLVPPSWLDWLARKVVGGCDECVLKSAGQLVTNPNFIKQSLGLAQFEMHQVRNEWEFQDKFISYNQEHSIRVRFLFSANDYWVHTHTMKDIIEFYETKYSRKSEDLLTISVNEEISHSFVLKDTVKVVDILY